nr:MAG TPA: hypothetical protein [Caudoviricetes sp.]
MAGIQLKFHKLNKILKNNGYQIDHQTGSHIIYKKGEKHISIPLCSLNGVVIQRLFKENDIKY